jgi:hypothetical protein
MGGQTPQWMGETASSWIEAKTRKLTGAIAKVSARKNAASENCYAVL